MNALFQAKRLVLRHLEVEVVALSAEVFRLGVHVVAVRAVELILIVRRGMRIGGLDVFGLLHQLLGVVALRAGFDGRHLGVGLVRSVTHRARHALGDMSVSAELISSLNAQGKTKQCSKKRSLFHNFSPVGILPC